MVIRDDPGRCKSRAPGIRAVTEWELVSAARETASRYRVPRIARTARRGSRSHDRYRGPVSSKRVPGGVVHKLPGDLRVALMANPTALDAWKDITPLARNEFICWVDDAKQEATRARRIRRTQEELEEGQRRPCCWPGCKHRERTGR
jgi:bacteriocin resistance YdeI/OmpD-like protein